MSSATPLVSIVCPAYQEESVLAAFHERLGSVLDSLGAGYRFEILYVDDGSRDGTLGVIRLLARKDGRVRYFSLSRNFGKEAAMTAGLDHSRGEAVVSLDTDLQHPPEVIPRMLECWREGHDLVLTARQQMTYPSLFRRLAADTFYGIMRKLQGSRPAATTDFVLLSRRVVDSLRGLRETHRYLRGLVSWVGFPSTTVPFTVAPRAGGQSKFNLLRLFGLAADGVLSFSRLPLQLAFFAGLGLLTLGLLDVMALVFFSLFGDGLDQVALHVLAMVELTVGGLVLCGMGIIGEYVGRIYEQVKDRPVYLLKENSDALEMAGAARSLEPRENKSAA